MLIQGQKSLLASGLIFGDQLRDPLICSDGDQYLALWKTQYQPANTQDVGSPAVTRIKMIVTRKIALNTLVCLVLISSDNSAIALEIGSYKLYSPGFDEIAELLHYGYKQERGIQLFHCLSDTQFTTDDDLPTFGKHELAKQLKRKRKETNTLILQFDNEMRDKGNVSHPEILIKAKKDYAKLKPWIGKYKFQRVLAVVLGEGSSPVYYLIGSEERRARRKCQ